MLNLSHLRMSWRYLSTSRIQSITVSIQVVVPAVKVKIAVAPGNLLSLIRMLRLKSKRNRRRNGPRLKRRDSRRNNLPVRRIRQHRKSVSVYH